MPRPGLVWSSLLGGLAVLDLWAARNTAPGDTLSEQIRALGIPRPAMAGLLGGTAVVLYRHLCKES